MNIKYTILNDSEIEVNSLKRMIINFFFFFEFVPDLNPIFDLQKIMLLNIDLIFIDESFIKNNYNNTSFFLEAFSKKNVLIVIITSESKMAIEMFKYNIFACIEKPISVENLSLVVNKIYTKEFLKIQSKLRP